MLLSLVLVNVDVSSHNVNRTYRQFETPKFWHFDEDKPLWSDSDKIFVKLKKNWVLNDVYIGWLSIAWKACTKGMQGTYQLEQIHGIWQRNKKKTETNVSVPKRMLDVLLAEIRYQFAHVRTIMKKGGDFPEWFLGNMNHLEEEMKTCDTLIDSQNANAFINIEYEKKYWDLKWTKIVKFLGWEKRNPFSQHCLNRLNAAVRLVMDSSITIDSALITQIKNNYLPQTASKQIVIDSLLEHGYNMQQLG